MTIESPIPLPSRIYVRVTPPSSGLAVRLRIEMKKKNSFGYTAFLDENGCAQISKEQLLSHFYQAWKMALMDYSDPQIAYSGKITATVLSNEGLERTIKAFHSFKDYVEYPADYEKDLTKALDKGQRPNDYLIELKIE